MRFASLIAAALTFGAIACTPAMSDEPARVVPAPAIDAPASTQTRQTAVLAGGCFWGVEGVFEHVRGVISVRSGYAGGDLERATYPEVSSGTTGHAESVEIVFDPRVISYGQILRIFFSVATDPTQLNRQGPDHGTQYRSNIFAADQTQTRIARAFIAQLNEANVYPSPIVTRVDALRRFVPAESYHQNYLSLHPDQPYIVVNDLPKIENLRRLFPTWYVQERVS